VLIKDLGWGINLKKWIIGRLLVEEGKEELLELKEESLKKKSWKSLPSECRSQKLHM
jgi:hypothetical protein